MSRAEDFPTELELKILRFFYEHPEAIETIRGMAVWLGGKSESLEGALQGLVHRKWISVHQSTALTGYGLTRDDRFLEQVREALDIP